jgi:hypothetical protein
MASDVDICNTGLSHLGARAQIAAISPPDGSVEAGYCARFYPIARQELIEAHNWSFVKTRVALAELTNDSTIWAYAYALPADCITPLRVLQLRYLTWSALPLPISLYVSDYDLIRYDQLFSERGSSDFEIEDGVLRTNEPDAVLLYKRDVTDTSKYSPTFVSAFGMLLASYLAGPIIKGLDGAKVGAQWRDAATAMAERAAARDANGSHEPNDHIPAHMAVR